MNIIVLQQSYPSYEHPYSQAWSHTRNKAYRKLGSNVKVFCPSESSSREFEGIDIYPIRKLNGHLEWADIILAHQPNIKFHFRTLLRIKNKKIIYFIHGHEVMFMNEDYSSPFSYDSQAKRLNKVIRCFYDRAKVFLLRRLFRKQNIDCAGFIFVSEWMKEIFEKRVRIDLDLKRYRYKIIPNSVSESFRKGRYEASDDVYADFVSIRQWDWSKHAVDLVIESALSNKSMSYHIYGKGEFPKHISVPDNVRMIDGFLAPDTIPALLDHYRCALMPTRVDSQGVMACEMASYGIPLITSDISVAREFLSDFSNVSFISNSGWHEPVSIPPTSSNFDKNYLSSNSTCSKEIEFFKYFIDTKVVK